jgi:hypothetical protein
VAASSSAAATSMPLTQKTPRSTDLHCQQCHQRSIRVHRGSWCCHYQFHSDNINNGAVQFVHNGGEAAPVTQSASAMALSHTYNGS